MNTVIYQNPFGETIVEECTRKELVDEVAECLRDLRDGYVWNDCSIWVEYADGSYFSFIDGDVDGRFLKTNIVGIIIDEFGVCYRVYGNYKMTSGNMIVELVWP